VASTAPDSRPSEGIEQWRVSVVENLVEDTPTQACTSAPIALARGRYEELIARPTYSIANVVQNIEVRCADRTANGRHERRV